MHDSARLFDEQKRARRPCRSLAARTICLQFSLFSTTLRCLGRDVETGGKAHKKLRAHLHLRFSPDTPAVALNDLPRDGKAHARPLHRSIVQTLENPEDAFRILLFESRSVVREGDYPVADVPVRLDMNGWRILGPVLDGVGDQVLDDL